MECRACVLRPSACFAFHGVVPLLSPQPFRRCSSTRAADTHTKGQVSIAGSMLKCLTFLQGLRSPHPTPPLPSLILSLSLCALA